MATQAWCCKRCGAEGVASVPDDPTRDQLALAVGADHDYSIVALVAECVSDGTFDTVEIHVGRCPQRPGFLPLRAATGTVH